MFKDLFSFDAFWKNLGYGVPFLVHMLDRAETSIIYIIKAERSEAVLMA